MRPPGRVRRGPGEEDCCSATRAWLGMAAPHQTDETIWSRRGNARGMRVYNRGVPALVLSRAEQGSDAGVVAARPAATGRLLLTECCTPGSAFAGLVAATAERHGVDHRALSVRTLLHLPRVATGRGYVSRTQVDRELYFTA